MNSSNQSRRLAQVLAIAAAMLAAPAAYALDGANAIQFTPHNGWAGFELVTQGDNIAAIADGGYGSTASFGKYDGLGASLSGGVISIAVNHETTPAAISRVDVDRAKLRQAVDSVVGGGVPAFPPSMVAGMGYAYNTIYDGAYHAVNNPAPAAAGSAAVAAYSSANFARFCSGTMHEPNAFGAGRGIVDRMYMTGEELFNGTGKFYALEAATRDLWEVPAVGTASWENAALVDTGNETHVALVLMSDLGASPGDYIRLYVGKKNVDANGDGAVDFLERNGLRGGSVYYFDPIGSASTTDLPDGAVAGAWSASTAGALRETKLEDIHTNPRNGKQAVFGASNDGVYRMDAALQFPGGVFDPAGSMTFITQLRDDDLAPLQEPDNLVWSADGNIYVQEDGSGNDMYQMSADGSSLVNIATAFSEPSGIMDASALVGYKPGSVLFTSIQGSGAAGAQLSVMISPNAAPAPTSAGFDADGDVDGADFLAWQRGLGTGALASEGDADQNGVVNAADLAVWRTQFGNPPPVAAVPEPSGAVVLASTLGLLLGGRSLGRLRFVAVNDRRRQHRLRINRRGRVRRGSGLQ